MSTPQQGGVSVDDATLEKLLESESVPSLATLFRAAKQQGALGPVTSYIGEGSNTEAPQAPPF